ncbi:hypothetical protein AB1Y20_012193 [Prymnesium parvum]|uniref:Methyltransferase FkbM domain-containing protein n=1 Tax=Prymnesium parvum TaxID=97485 RepID=A0AB34IMU8_PRYPA
MLAGPMPPPEMGANGTCLCVEPHPPFSHPARPPQCFFFDLGLNVGDSTVAFFDLNHNDPHFPHFPCIFHKASSYVGACTKTATAARQILGDVTLPALRERGLEPRDCHVVGVEMLGKYSSPLSAVAANLSSAGRSVEFLLERAATTCEANLSYSLSKFATDGLLPAAGLGRAKHRVRSVNVLRLLMERTQPQDFVVMKMDLEGHEYHLIPCLASSRRARTLIDQLFVEEHGLMNWAEYYKLENAYKVLRPHMLINTRWP